MRVRPPSFAPTGPRRARRSVALTLFGVAVAVAGLLGPAAAPVAAQTDTTAAPVDPATAPVDPAAAPVDPAATAAVATTTPPTTIGGTTTTVRPAVCDAVPPTVAQFVGTVTATGQDSVQFRVDEMRSGATGATTVQVLYVRDARFLKDGRQYLVTASVDTDTKLLVSKVRTKRGEDPRCTVKDPIYTRNVDGTPADSGVFSGLKGHSRDVLMAFLKPLGGVLAVLLGLVLVKYLLYFGGKGIRWLVSGPAARRPVR